jgi:hypothetical protein
MKPTTEIKKDGRVCTHCLEFKLWDLFNKDNHWINWRYSYCKSCNAIRKKKYNDSQRWKMVNKNYKILNKDKYIQWHKKWLERNRENLKEYNKKYYNEHKEKINNKRKEVHHEQSNFYYSIWKKVYYNETLWIIRDYVYRKWCLVEFADKKKLWIWKNRLKPKKFITYKLNLW